MSVRLQALRARVGGVVMGNRGVFPGPGHSKHDRSLSLWDIGDRVLAHSFCGDGRADIAAYLQAHGVEEAGSSQMTLAGRRRYKALARKAAEEDRAENERKQVIAFALYDGAQPLCGLAETYLRGRGVDSRIIAAARRADLRFAPAAPLAPYKPDRRTAPAMLGLVTNQYNTPIGLHMTFLAADGAAKAGDKPRLMLCRQPIGMVRLSSKIPDGVLAVAEGIETALSYATLKGVPCWSARSAGGLERWRPPDGTTRILIAADGDEPGLHAAEELRLSLRAFMQCEIDAAPAGADWNDVLRGEA